MSERYVLVAAISKCSCQLMSIVVMQASSSHNFKLSVMSLRIHAPIAVPLHSGPMSNRNATVSWPGIQAILAKRLMTSQDSYARAGLQLPQDTTSNIDSGFYTSLFGTGLYMRALFYSPTRSDPQSEYLENKCRRY